MPITILTSTYICTYIHIFQYIGKTNIAMLTFLWLLKQHMSDGSVDREAVKAVYIAPMKALAQEVVEKFSERLKPLGMTVREFTGDMQVCFFY